MPTSLRQVEFAHGRYLVCQSGLYDSTYTAEVLAKRWAQYRFGATKKASPMPGFDTTKVGLSSSTMPYRGVLTWWAQHSWNTSVWHSTAALSTR